MKFGKTCAELEAAEQQEEKAASWHRWFAWRPVRLDDTCQYVWLETIWRKRDPIMFHSEFDPIYWYMANKPPVEV